MEKKDSNTLMSFLNLISGLEFAATIIKSDSNKNQLEKLNIINNVKEVLEND